MESIGNHRGGSAGSDRELASTYFDERIPIPRDVGSEVHVSVHDFLLFSFTCI